LKTVPGAKKQLGSDAVRYAGEAEAAATRLNHIAKKAVPAPSAIRLAVRR
jgi:hypothetical protein